MLWGVIIAGGSGERFWPKSRQKTPKQLLPITNIKTMIQLTVERISGIIDISNILIITNTFQKEEMMLQLPLIPKNNIIAEPLGRDTAAAIGLAAVIIQDKDQDSQMFVLPADQVIHDTKKFEECVNDAVSYVKESNCLLTFGIKPYFPATGYGYLNYTDKVDFKTKTNFYNVKKFVEKPDIEKAKQYLDTGNFLWNSGMFIWKVNTILKEIEKQMLPLYESLTIIQDKIHKGFDINEILNEVYPNLIKKSIDYGIMENAQNVKCALSEFDWDDIGTWDAVGKHFTADKSGNIIIGLAKLIDCTNVLVYNLTKNNTLMASAIDIHDQILIQTEDAVITCPKNSSQKIKNIVELLKKENLTNFF